MALVSVSAIGVTGIYAAYLRVGSFQALYTSIYGEALLLKQVFVGLLLLLAAFNLLVISPRLKKARLAGASDTILVARFGKMVLAEIILGSLLLLSVSLLTYLPPTKITPPSFDLNNSINADDLHVSINISPGLVGQNTFTVNLTSNGQPVDNIKEALLRFTPGQQNVSPSEAQLLVRYICQLQLFADSTRRQPGKRPDAELCGRDDPAGRDIVCTSHASARRKPGSPVWDHRLADNDNGRSRPILCNTPRYRSEWPSQPNRTQPSIHCGREGFI
jgi:hypothetical protein